MNDWPRGTTRTPHPHPVGIPDIFELVPDPAPHRTTCAATPGASCVTAAGADWLASASTLPASVHALWRHRPGSPSVLPCGTAFDVVSAAPLTGRLILERLWSSGPGSGPVAVHRGRVLLFAAPGTAQRLPALLSWGEWKTCHRRADAAPAETFPSLLCLGPGDSVTIPALHCEHRPGPLGEHTPPDDPARRFRPSRWLVAPDVRRPWLPGPEVLLRACVRPRRDRTGAHPQTSVRAGRGPGSAEQPISGTADRDARVYDVTRRR
ncbi:hypothetical protein [Streptomyces sp. WMMB 322]|uniref:bifunctional DNA primase/polymerase n=1 Tax=Streptomyces sp. WMMB 322 TaxID=1286821 RepID=UPI000944C7FA|nr:hypothetical protein [Streptomyces sp. WMMB 322]